MNNYRIYKIMNFIGCILVSGSSSLFYITIKSHRMIELVACIILDVIGISMIIYSLYGVSKLSYNELKTMDEFLNARKVRLASEGSMDIVDINDTDIKFNRSYFRDIPRNEIIDGLKIIIKNSDFYTVSNTCFIYYFVKINNEVIEAMENIFTLYAITNMRKCSDVGYIDMTKIIIDALTSSFSDNDDYKLIVWTDSNNVNRIDPVKISS